LRSGSKLSSSHGQATASGLLSSSQSNLLEEGPWGGHDSDGEPEPSPILSDTFEHSLWCEDNLAEDHSHVAYEFGSDVDSGGDTDSSLRAAQSSSPFLSFEVERELRREAMIMKSESSSPSSKHASYFTDSHSNSDKEEEEEEESVTAVPHAASLASPPDSMSNDIALQLATQLYAFQGCTEKQHEEQDRQHQKHHQRGDVDSNCASLADILPIIQGRGVDRSMPPLPDVLSLPGIMKAEELRRESCASAFEGTAPFISGLLEEDGSHAGSQAPKNLCLSVYHGQSQIASSPEVTYDIDSICGVANSLAVARLGIQWLPKSFPILNIAKDIHLVLRASYTTKNGRLASRYTPLHKIPHYCFGQLEGIESVKVYIVFPNLRSKIDYDYTSFLTRKEDED